MVIHAPGGDRPLGTELGMRRLIHHAQDAGKVIAIATRSGALASRATNWCACGPQASARPLGCRRQARHPGGQAEPCCPSVGRYVQVAVIAAVAFVALFLVLAMAPSATVTAYPPTETVSEVITITASESRTEVDLKTLEAPASRVSAERKFTLAAKTTGSTQVGTVPAKARVTITNSTQAAVAVAQGSVVLAGPEFFPFVVDETATVPAGGAVEASVTARRPGVAGNVPAGTINGWEAERLRFLGLTNAAAAAGGLSKPGRLSTPKTSRD